MTVTETFERRTVTGVGETAGSDEVLVARLRAGDERALHVIYDRHGDVVFGISRRVTGDEHLAREITQEVFIHLWKHPDRVDLTRGSIRTYLAVVAHHRAVDEIRRGARQHRAESRAVQRVVPCEDGHEATVVDGAERSWRSDRVAKVLALLPDDQRSAVTLAYFDGCTYVEVARRLGIPEGTAKSRIRLALTRLRTLLADESWAVT